jgi:peptidoglycan/xylan/chitin deacetylase (PgdA/CDA1 family)
MASLKRGLEAGRLLLDLVSRDPAFVRGGDLAPRDIPVFTFHGLEPRSFERKMRHILDAGYRAIDLDLYLKALLGGGAAPAKSVLITIDDGRATTWTVGYPILKELGMRATAFLVTSAVHDSSEVSKTIGDVPEGQWGPLVARDDSPERPFVTWAEARAMRDVIDLGSHTHLHARIPVSLKTAGVMTEAMRRGYGEFDCPFIWIEGRAVRGRDVPVGTPLPDSAPRLSGRPAYRSVDQRCETGTEVREAVRFDLEESRRLLREKTGAEAETLCFPWHVDSPLARELAKKIGYLAAFSGKVSSGPRISRPGADPFGFARIGEDYVERLPGPGRRSLLSVLWAKLRRNRVEAGG